MERRDKASADSTPDYPGMPRWVKTSGIIVAVVAVLVVALVIFGGGQHGPGRHLPALIGSDAKPAAASPSDRE